MSRESVKQWLRDWDEDRFDLTERTARPVVPKEKKSAVRSYPAPELMQALEDMRYAIFEKVYPAAAVLLLLVMSACLLLCAVSLPRFGAADNPAHNEVMQRYLEQGMEETGAVNAVAGVILDYRAFDTLGESHVLFTALISVLILLLAGEGEEPPAGPADPREGFVQRDPLLKATARVLVPGILMLGIATVVNGHLGPGGGFSGGAILGAGLILYSLAFGFDALEKIINLKTFKITVPAALCFYSLAKAYSFFCGANGLESFISAGVPGRILSAGLILPLDIAVGLVVACTMYGIYSLFKRGRI